MKLERIITLVNDRDKLQFFAMERSLRATGCNLPIWAIPYDNNLFDLPENSIWWHIPEITSWLEHHKAHPMMRKYQCLTVGNYQFVDTDIIFLINPEVALKEIDGFITSCGHWQNPQHTFTNESLPFFKAKSTMWQKFVFNAGQFACDRPLYSVDELIRTAQSEKFYYTCLKFPYHDQPGLNLLVNNTNVTIRNLTMPPYNMESSWAGDYLEDNYMDRWSISNKPYLLHWAGEGIVSSTKVINNLFLDYLSSEEKKVWSNRMSLKYSLGKNKHMYHHIRTKIKAIYKILLKENHE